MERFGADPVGWVRHQLGEWPWSKEIEILEAVRDHSLVAVHACNDSGKGLALDTPIPTPAGWTTMGALQPGDLVFDEDGQPVPVLWVSSDRNLECHEVVFDDGSAIVCDRDHLWQTITFERRRRNRTGDWRDLWDSSTTLNTVELAGSVLTDRGQRRHRIPACRPLALPPARFPLDPYLLGVWLGDGTTIRSDITTADDEIADAFRSVGFDLDWRSRLTFNFAYPRERTANVLLDEVGVLGNKHIPEPYLRASIDQRLALLQGLMDSDGSIVSHTAACNIDLCDEKLATGVAELIRTFGWRVRLKKGIVHFGGKAIDRWRMHFRPDLQVFRLPRKADVLAPHLQGGTAQRSRRTTRIVVEVRPVPSVTTRCMAVDSPRSLFLAGPSMIPTHNSFTAARAAGWWVDTHEPGQAFVASTAPTFDQVQAILWQEINRAHEKGNLVGRVNLTEWWIGQILAGYGRKPADTNPTGFLGIHRRHVLVILDEACGIPKPLWTAADRIATNADARILALGNPDDATSHFAEVCKPGSGWHVIHIDGLETPNFSGEDVPDDLRPMLLDPGWVEDKKLRWGENSPLYISAVRGQFPEDAEDGVVRASKVAACRVPQPDPPDSPVELGVDVGAGGDFTSIRERRGPKAGRVWRDHSRDSEQVVGLIVKVIRETGATRVKVDTIGIGWGVVGHLRSLEGEHHAQIVPVNVGESSSDKERFPLLRDQLWWEIGRELSEDGTWDLSDVDDDTIAQLLAPKYGLDAHGRVKIEPKDETRKRIGRSPDDADALLLAFYVGAMPGTAVSSAHREL